MIRIGHTFITHGYLMNNTHPSVCEECNSQITLKHLLQDSGNYDEIAGEYLGKTQDF